MKNPETQETEAVGNAGSGAEGPLSPEDLARDFAMHPENYHGSLHAYVEEFLARHALRVVGGDEVERTVESTRSFDEILEILRKDDSNERLTSYDAVKLIDFGLEFEIFNNSEKFVALDASVVDKLLDCDHHYLVAEHLEIFTGIDYDNLARKFISSDQAIFLVRNLEKFIGVDHNEIACSLVNANYGRLVVGNLEKFTGVDYDNLAHMLINTRQGYPLARNLDEFIGVDHNEIAHRLIDTNQTGAIGYYLERFTNLDMYVANALIDEGFFIKVLQYSHVFGRPASEFVLDHIDKIEEDADLADAALEHLFDYGMDKDAQNTVLWACASHYSTAQKVVQLDLEALIGVDKAAELRAHIAELKSELRGVKKYHPYADKAGDIEHATSSRPGTEFHAEAVKVARRLRHPETDSDSELVAKIQQAYDTLQADVASQYGEQYAQDLFGERGSKTGDTWPTYRRLVADYIAEAGEADVVDALKEAARAFMQVLRVDTSYYDKLFREWDAKRIGEREFQEVFLGRDGIYAYVGRRAQLYARRRKLGMSSRQAGGPFMEFPTYLVYPRGFRDDFEDETKAKYLRPRIENPLAAHYYDTGFTGSIPDDIMRVLGVTEIDRDKRIRLLSANKRPRTVLGLRGGKSDRDKIVGMIEHNVKDEESAEGLYETDDGRLEPYSEPTDPSERLAFRMTQLALHRHYYVRELNSMDPVNLGYEASNLNNQREMRIDGNYSEAAKNQLKELFSSDNIGAELLKSAAALKVANPNDPYPDEAVFELPLPGGAEAIVKNVVGAKQQGPVDEFEALLLLRKLGVDAPKPIARVFTSGQKGFLVMEKIYGESGRSIRDFFSKNDISESSQRELMTDALSRMQEISEIVRRDTGLDKPWRLKDFIIEFDKDEHGQLRIKSMRPIDFERAKVFDPDNPHSVKLGQGLDELV